MMGGDSAMNDHRLGLLVGPGKSSFSVKMEVGRRLHTTQSGSRKEEAATRGNIVSNPKSSPEGKSSMSSFGEGAQVALVTGA